MLARMGRSPRAQPADPSTELRGRSQQGRPALLPAALPRVAAEAHGQLDEVGGFDFSPRKDDGTFARGGVGHAFLDHGDGRAEGDCRASR